jgi:chlorobactene glucosyltransferase
MNWISQVTGWQMALLAIYALLVAVAAARHILVSYELRRVRFLTPKSPHFDGPEAPLVSILVPAKDEAAGIEACLASLCAQDYPNFEILVVDDRSQDETASIVSRWAARDPRIRLLRISDLPPQWTGKTHALHQCQQQARGEWLFFVDADTRLHPSCLSVTLRDCLDAGADIESLMPSLASKSFWVSVVQPLASTMLLQLYPLSRANDPGSKDRGFANGQFILVRRDSYRAIGGHEAVRTQLCEDIQLGRLARAHDLRLRIVVAPKLATTWMYSSLKDVLSGWSRIFYSAVDQGIGPLRMLTVTLSLFSFLPVAVLLLGGIAVLAGSSSAAWQATMALALAQQLCQWTLYARLYAAAGTPLRYLPFQIVGAFVMLQVLRRAMHLCRTHEVSWRGTNYTSALRQRDAAA